jgi:hypothetical protein
MRGNGVACGRFFCAEPEIRRMKEGDKWFDGTVISVVTETIVQSAGAMSKAFYIPPQVLHSAGRILTYPNDERVVKAETGFVLKEGQSVRVFFFIPFMSYDLIC